MRDPLGLNERFFAWYYPKVLAASEKAGQADTRHELLAGASGRTLEIGAGNGYNLPHYTPAVTELVISEPSPHMRDHLRERLEEDPPQVGSCELIDAGGEELPFPDSSFDTVVGGYILCSIPDPAKALGEMARVLRPGGKYLFLEHVHAGEGTMLGRVQDAIEIPHRYFAAGCHPNRRTEKLIAASPLDIESIEHRPMPKSIPTVRPTIVGSAVLPAP